MEEVVVVSLYDNYGGLLKILAVCKNMDKAKDYVMGRIEAERKEYDYPKPKIAEIPCEFYGMYIDASFYSQDFGEFTLHFGLEYRKLID